MSAPVLDADSTVVLRGYRFALDPTAVQRAHLALGGDRPVGVHSRAHEVRGAAFGVEVLVPVQDVRPPRAVGVTTAQRR